MNSIVVVAPHPDDETLGCGGTILRGNQIGIAWHWLIMTDIEVAHEFTQAEKLAEGEQIRKVAASLGCAGLHQLKNAPSSLDTLPLATLISQVADVFRQVNPAVVYVPFPGDAHSDHAAAFSAAIACTKWFRFPTIQRILVYETPSETDFSIQPDINAFRPNVFVDISGHIEQKIDVMNLYGNQLGQFPFPRSEKAVRALGAVRGAASGYASAEAFMLLRERVS